MLETGRLGGAFPQNTAHQAPHPPAPLPSRWLHIYQHAWPATPSPSFQAGPSAPAPHTHTNCDSDTISWVSTRRSALEIKVTYPPTCSPRTFTFLSQRQPYSALLRPENLGSSRSQQSGPFCTKRPPLFPCQLLRSRPPGTCRDCFRSPLMGPPCLSPPEHSGQRRSFPGGAEPAVLLLVRACGSTRSGLPALSALISSRLPCPRVFVPAVPSASPASSHRHLPTWFTPHQLHFSAEMSPSQRGFLG